MTASSLTSPTHAVGAAMLRSEWQTAIDLVMAPFPDDSGRGDTGERQAREAWAATRDPDAHDPDRPSSFDAMHTALVVKDPIHHADIATHPLYGAATPAVGAAW